MIVSVKSLLNLYQFPTGRRLYCLRRLLEEIEGSGLDELRSRVERAIAADEETKDLEWRWRGSQGRNEHGPDAPLLNAELCRALSALDENLASTSKALGESSDPGLAANRAREQLFPNGVRAVTRLPYVEQEESVRAMLRRVRDERELARSLRELGVQAFVLRLAEINQRFNQALEAKAELGAASYERVLEARAFGQESFCKVVFAVVNLLMDCGPKCKYHEALSNGLSKILGQNEAIRRYYRRRRRATDVDPETGSEIDAFDGEEDEDPEVLVDDPEHGARPRVLDSDAA